VDGSGLARAFFTYAASVGAAIRPARSRLRRRRSTCAASRLIDLRTIDRHRAGFYDALEKIPEHKAWWNPIRELGDAADN